MKIAYLIINYNDYETTIQLIDNIKSYRSIDTILVVDNCSSDSSFEQLKKIDNITVIQTPSNKGYGYGINYGSKYLISKYGQCYIIVSNPDVIISREEDLLKLIYSFDQETAIVAPVIKENNQLNRGWKIPRPIDDILSNIIYFHKFFSTRYKDDYYKDSLVEVGVVSGCFFVIKSIDLQQVNYFDENVFLYYEENIIAKKLEKINKKIKINNDVVVIHNHSVTIDKNVNSINKYKLLKQSQMYFEKNYNSANAIERFFLFLTNKITLLFLKIFYSIKRKSNH